MPKRDSETALLAFLCIKLVAKPEAAQTDYLKKQLRVNMSGSVARQVGARHTWIPPKGVPGGARPERRNEALRSWMLVDEALLGYKQALVHFPGEGARQVDLLASLRREAGVRQIIETRERRDVYAVVLFAPEQEDKLLARMEGFGRCYWNGISEDDHTPALRTWESLLKLKSSEENLRVPKRRKGAKSSG